MIQQSVNQQNTQPITSQQVMNQPNMSQQGINQQNVPQLRLAFHETMEIHELLNFKTICMVNSKLMSGIVFDQDLKALLEKDVQQSMTAIGELKSIYQAGPQFSNGM